MRAIINLSMCSISNDINDIIKLNIIRNALDHGWTVAICDNKTIILKKKKNDLLFDENNSDILIDKLLNVMTFKRFGTDNLI
jgi:hypothetical protein